MKLKPLVLSIIYYCLSAFGISLTIKAGVGVSSLNSLNATLSEGSGIKVGTITMLVHGVFLIFCLFLDKEKKALNYLLMAGCLLGFGSVINFCTYHLLTGLTVNSYFFGLCLFVLGTFFAGFGAGRILAYGILQFPIEKACQLLEEQTRFSFSFYRYGVDLISVLLSLVLSLSFQMPLFVREGTIISLFLLSFVIIRAKNGFSYRTQKV